MTAIGAFRRAFFNPELGSSSPLDFDMFCRWESRDLRYRVLWALYSNTAFWDEVHRWSAPQKQQNSLYAWTRPNFNPVQRIVEFGATHIVGGQLDPLAGDGVKVKSALPIETKSNAVRAGIAQLWRHSQMAVEKDIIGRNGTALGDIAIKVCDDPAHGRVKLKTVHPGTIRWVKRDPDTGRILAYLLEEQRYNPLRGQNLSPLATGWDRGPSCVYNEEAWIEDGKVHYKTYLEKKEFDWRLKPDGMPFGTGPGAQPEWDVPYGFIPLILIQHLAIGLAWGLAEAHTGVGKFFEMADVGSNIGDHVRRVLNAALYISGVADPEHEVAIKKADDATMGNPHGGRTKQGIIYLSAPEAKLQFSVQPIDVPGVSGHVKMLKDDSTEDYPEIDMDLWKSGDPSGKALRVARQRAESKVQQRRTGYDAGIADAQKIALGIAGIRGYDGYETLGTEDPFSDPVVEHTIAHRPVFSPDPMDDVEQRTAEYLMIKAGRDADIPLEVLLKREDWSEKEIAEVMAAKDAAAQQAVDQVNQRMAAAGGVIPGGNLNA